MGTTPAKRVGGPASQRATEAAAQASFLALFITVCYLNKCLSVPGREGRLLPELGAKETWALALMRVREPWEQVLCANPATSWPGVEAPVCSLQPAFPQTVIYCFSLYLNLSIKICYQS